MTSFNVIILAGHLTRDPETRYTQNGTAIADTGIAVNRVWKTDSGEKREEAMFIDLAFWGRQAEVAAEYLRKGSPVLIEGELRLDTWDDKQTGQKRSRHRVTVKTMQMLGGKTEGSQHPSTGQQSPPRSAPSPQRPRDPDG